ncbi:MAG: hypothetical protein BMS9Abin31_0968 [Gammaproteobacteria bacterium]|nr:MAG: hypothetical protein BMS9Abin31_0968 [Gammaproteobacteria bacterium]
MSSFTEYVFCFDLNGEVIRIPYAKWKRIREGEEVVEDYVNQTVYIAYAYILLESRKPDYCPRIDGAIYYFDKKGKVILDRPHYFDIFQDGEEEAGGVINLQHRKKIKEVAEKYHWKLKSEQIQKVIDCIW